MRTKEVNVPWEQPCFWNGWLICSFIMYGYYIATNNLFSSWITPQQSIEPFTIIKHCTQLAFEPDQKKKVPVKSWQVPHLDWLAIFFQVSGFLPSLHLMHILYFSLWGLYWNCTTCYKSVHIWYAYSHADVRLWSHAFKWGHMGIWSQPPSAEL